MWMMLQHEKPLDLVIATGVMNSVRDFVESSAQHLGIEIIWRGEGVNEVGVDKKTGKVLIEIDPRYFRPNEVDLLCGDATKAFETIGWKPQRTFAEIVEEMTMHDYELLRRELK